MNGLKNYRLFFENMIVKDSFRYDSVKKLDDDYGNVYVVADDHNGYIVGEKYTDLLSKNCTFLIFAGYSIITLTLFFSIFYSIIMDSSGVYVFAFMVALFTIIFSVIKVSFNIKNFMRIVEIQKVINPANNVIFNYSESSYVSYNSVDNIVNSINYCLKKGNSVKVRELLDDNISINNNKVSVNSSVSICEPNVDKILGMFDKDFLIAHRIDNKDF